jgi:hypothetical protein
LPLFTRHDRVFITLDGRLVAQGVNSVFTDFARGCIEIDVRVPDLRMIEHVLHIQFKQTPLNCSFPVYGVQNKKITGNVVGMTIMGYNYVGTTLEVEVIAVGPP